MFELSFQTVGLLLLVVLPFCQAMDHFSRTAGENIPFQDLQDGLVGLKNADDEICLLAYLKARLVIRRLGDEINNENEAIKPLPNLAQPTDVTIGGYCSLNDDRNQDAVLVIIWDDKNGDNFRIELHFSTTSVQSKITNVPEWRWQLHNVAFRYTPAGNRGDSNSIAAIAKKRPAISAPILQSFICQDSLNVTLRGLNGPADLTLQLARDIQLQPFGIVEKGRFGNTYLCMKTRQRGLLESLRSRTTVFFGVILGITSVGTIVGYGAKRQLFLSDRHYQMFH